MPSTKYPLFKETANSRLYGFIDIEFDGDEYLQVKMKEIIHTNTRSRDWLGAGLHAEPTLPSLQSDEVMGLYKTLEEASTRAKELYENLWIEYCCADAILQ